MDAAAPETSSVPECRVANMEVATSSPTAFFETNEAGKYPACGHEQEVRADTAPQNGSIRARPAPLPVLPENIPDAVRQRPQWVCWRWTWKTDKEKWDKPPFNARTGEFASSADKSTWSSFEVAWAAYLDPANQYSGIGYVFSGEADDFIGVDLDDCRDVATGEIRPWTPEQRACKHWAPTAPDPADIIKLLETYAEVSPSGTGVKLLARGALEKGMKRGDFEMYRAGRYFTVTGHRIPESPSAIVDNADTALLFLNVYFAGKDKEKEPSKRPKAKKPVAKPSQVNGYSPSANEIIAACRRAANAAKFEQLFSGNTSGYQSQSEADLALCSIIAFYVAGQATLVDQVFRQSRLYRHKWDDVHDGDGRTYGEMTVATALSGCVQQFDWNARGASPSPQTHVVGGIALIPKKLHRTASKVTITLELCRDGQPFDVLKLSDATSGRAQCQKAILAHLGDAANQEGAAARVDAALGAILVDAGRRKDSKDPESKEVHQILAEHIPGDVKLLYAAETGKAYSETLQRIIGRTAFVERYVNNKVLALVANATDAPRDEEGEVLRAPLIAMLERELKVLWGDLLNGLGVIAEVELAPDSPTAEAYRQAIYSLWLKPASMGIHKQEVSRRDHVQLATRNSLASRVNRMLTEGPGPVSDRWSRVHEGFAAYVRASQPSDGSRRIFLAMRFELADQIGMAIPDTANQKDLRRLGAKFGAIDSEPPVPDRMTGGGRLAVLSPAVVEHILSEPVDQFEASLASDTGLEIGLSDDQHRPSSVTGAEVKITASDDERPMSVT